MTQEEKRLLLIDLCAREPYYPRIQVFNQGYEGFQDGELDTNLWIDHIDAFRFDRIEILPYLRPMSSMTEEEYKDLEERFCWDFADIFDKNRFSIEIGYSVDIDEVQEFIDWLNQHHFDYRGLIEKGLALEAPEGMYNFN